MEGIMPQVSTITLTENTNDHVFNPITVSSKKSVLTTSEANTPIGEMVLTLGFDPYSGNRSTDHVTVGLKMPQELGDATNGYTVSDSALFDGKFILPKTFSTATRAIFADLVAAAVSNAITKAYQARDPFWG
jgi:hypothetical protein